MRPKRTRKDSNHAEIVSGCRELGIIVWDTADSGGKVLDTVMFWHGVAIPIEIKSPGKEDDLTKGERKGIAELQNVNVPPVVVTSVEDVVRAFELRR